MPLHRGLAFGAALAGAIIMMASVAPAQAKPTPDGSPPQPTKTIVPAAGWTDDTGRMVQAHGVGITKVDSTYYMFGEDKTAGGVYTAVACYSSEDLTNWRFGGNALSRAASGDLGPDRVVERPKVIYNEATRQYVMYLHIDDRGYQEAKVGVATSPTPCGPYTYHGSSRPLGFQSRDIGLFKDDDGTGYLLTEDRANGLRIDKLSADYLTVENTVAIVGGLESPAMVKVDGRYFLFGSHLTGWSTNDNEYATATSLAGPWSDFAKFAPAGSKTFDSQTSTIVPIQGSRGTSYVYVGDRWRRHDLFHSLPVWLPIKIAGDKAELNWHDSWSLDVGEGTWLPQNADTTYVPAPSTDPLRFDGVRAPLAGNYTVKIGYTNGDATGRRGYLQVDGGAAVPLYFPPTGGGHGVVTTTVFLSAATHTVTVGNPYGPAPSVDKIELPNGPGTALALTAPPRYPSAVDTLVKPGEDTAVNTTFSNYGPSSTSGVQVSLAAPDGWTVTPRTSAAGDVAPGDALSTSWAVRAPAGAAPGVYAINATGGYDWNGRQTASVDATLSVRVPPPAPSGTVYASDVEWVHATNGWGPVERDTSNGEDRPGDGRTITLGGVAYAKGIGAHPTSTVLIYTGGSCDTFTATVGVDDEVGNQGSVTFEVWADGRKIAETGVLRGGDPGAPLSADIAGTSELELRATDAGDGNSHDHADWADAQLTC